jgi:aspartate aminotransferase
LYGAFRTVVDPGDMVVYPVPSWNNNHYVYLTGGHGVAVPTRAADGFMPTIDLLRPHLSSARMICLNSPLNPTGTVITESILRPLVEAVVEENERRRKAGRRYLFLLHDQVYAALCFGEARHHLPAALVPEAAPWVIGIDGISKVFAATGLRVGWVLAAPPVVRRMKSLFGHVGAWAPRPEQVATARFLRDAAAVQAYRERMAHDVAERLHALADGFLAMRAEGYTVDCIRPQGAIYLSLQLDLVGRTLAGRRIETNEQIRKLLLDEAGLAVVPFQAFGLPDETGWFRLSVGAVSMQDITDSFPRVRALLDRLDPAAAAPL